MGGKNSGYIWGPLQMAAGAGLMFVPGGQAIGIPLIAAGMGETIGQGAGGSKGAGIGELAGGLAGGAGEGFMGLGPLSSMAVGPFQQNIQAGAAASGAAGGGGIMDFLKSAGGGQIASAGMSDAAKAMSPSDQPQTPGPPQTLSPPKMEAPPPAPSQQPAGGAPPLGTPAVSQVPAPGGGFQGQSGGGGQEMVALMKLLKLVGGSGGAMA